MPKSSRAPLALVVSPDRRALPDADLARGLGLGEAWAVTEAWRRFAPMVLVTAERALGSKAEADDLAQEVFYRVFRRAKTLRDPDSLRSFIYSVAIRVLKSQLRFRRARSWLSFHGPETLADDQHFTLDVESRDLLRKLYALLDRLSPRDRVVFFLRRVESMTIEEIATAMDLSASTVKRSMANASSKLSRWLSANPDLSRALGGRIAEERE